MKNGVYFNTESEVFGLYWNGEFLLISCSKEDCESELEILNRNESGVLVN